MGRKLTKQSLSMASSRVQSRTSSMTQISAASGSRFIPQASNRGFASIGRTAEDVASPKSASPSARPLN